MREIDVLGAIADRPWPSDDPHRFVPELGLCQAEARIDAAIISTRALVGWEIKTRTDKLNRLPRQERVYSRVFDRMWLAADDRHIDQALEVIPDWWGVVRVSEREGACRLTQVRNSRINRSVDLHSLVRLLWRDEVITELTSLGLGAGVAHLPKRDLWPLLASASPRHISATQLRSRVRLRIMAREDWRSG